MRKGHHKASCVSVCDGTTDNLASPNVLNIRCPAVCPGTALQKGRSSTDHRKRFRSLDALCAVATAALLCLKSWSPHVSRFGAWCEHLDQPRLCVQLGVFLVQGNSSNLLCWTGEDVNSSSGMCLGDVLERCLKGIYVHVAIFSNQLLLIFPRNQSSFIGEK